MRLVFKYNLRSVEMFLETDQATFIRTRLGLPRSCIHKPIRPF